MPDISLRVYARDSETNDPIAGPNVFGTISLVTEEGTLIPLAENVTFNSKAFHDITPIPRNGLYHVDLMREGYINKVANLTVEATSPGERVTKYVIMSKELTPEETRIIFTWETSQDMDLFVAGIEKDTDDLCIVSYANRDCPAAVLDR